MKYKNIKTKYKIPKNDAGTCFEKKASPKNIGIRNQNKLLFSLKPNIKTIKEAKEKITAWWSMNGVPEDGYANIEIPKA